MMAYGTDRHTCLRACYIDIKLNVACIQTTRMHASDDAMKIFIATLVMNDVVQMAVYESGLNALVCDSTE